MELSFSDRRYAAARFGRRFASSSDGFHLMHNLGENRLWRSGAERTKLPKRRVVSHIGFRPDCVWRKPSAFLFPLWVDGLGEREDENRMRTVLGTHDVRDLIERQGVRRVEVNDIGVVEVASEIVADLHLLVV